MRQIYAAYDAQGICVYQAFKPEIVQAALANGTFDAGFSLQRMTWIKPSFGWMLYRSGYATQTRQEAILKIKLSHVGFLEILEQSVETTHNPDVHADVHAWQQALKRSDVRHQWDPDRALQGYKLPRRAIQIGISGQTVQRYVNEWIIELVEVTALAHEIQVAVKNKTSLPTVPDERVYSVKEALAHRLGIQTGEEP